VSLIGCKIAAANRLPASFFVSVAYECWAFRRLGVRLDAATARSRNGCIAIRRAGGAHDEGEGLPADRPRNHFDRAADRRDGSRAEGGRRGAGRGEMYTGRDAVHAHLMKNPPPVDLHGAVLYHCGPVMLQEGGKWTVKAAGPTTSIREEPYQADVIKRYGVRAVIGKGGMGAKTLGGAEGIWRGVSERDRRRGAVLRADGARVLDVNLLDFGVPEAMWHLRVDNFPAIVTMDAHGNSLHADVEKGDGGRAGTTAARLNKSAELGLL
jgi:fumarate hydratase, class I